MCGYVCASALSIASPRKRACRKQGITTETTGSFWRSAGIDSSYVVSTWAACSAASAASSCAIDHVCGAKNCPIARVPPSTRNGAPPRRQIDRLARKAGRILTVQAAVRRVDEHVEDRVAHGFAHFVGDTHPE